MNTMLSMPEHDLEGREREQGDPGVGVGQELHVGRGVLVSGWLRARVAVPETTAHRRPTRVARALCVGTCGTG